MATKRKVGRPALSPLGATNVRVERDLMELADKVSAGMGELVGGMRPSRTDVLRSALRRGLEAMAADIEAKR